METKKQKQEKIKEQIKVLQEELEEVNKLCDKCGVNKYTKVNYSDVKNPKRLCEECFKGGNQ